MASEVSRKPGRGGRGSKWEKPEREESGIWRWWRGVEQGGGGVEVESGRELRLGRGRGGIKPGFKPLALSRPDRTIELATFEHYLSPSYANQPD